MVTTRSAEKRQVGAGKIEDLAVRPKVNETPATPTPSSAAGTKRSNISVNIPPPRKATTYTPGSRTTDGDDESPYMTAKESPGSYRDAESVLADTSMLNTPQAQPTSAGLDYRKRRALNDLQSSPSQLKLSQAGGSRSEASTSLDTSIQAQSRQDSTSGMLEHLESGTHVATQHSNALVSSELPLSKQASISDSAPDSDSSPEISTSKRTIKSRQVRRKTDKSTLSTSKDNMKSSDTRASLVEPINVDGQHISPPPEQITPGSIYAPITSQSSDATISARTDSLATVSSRTIVGDDISQGTEESALVARPASVTLKSTFLRPSIPQLPAAANNSLESFRQQIINNRVTASSGKRSRGFKLTDEWSGKRRKFITT